jgi:glycerol-3-phosphate dehydrogenase
VGGVIRSASLNLARRNEETAHLAAGEVMDVVVIGGGITGAGVALDAASRGLSVALVERRDLANGTSRWSSKLAHGGLRYLRQLEVGVAWESARERHLLMAKTATHLVRPLPFVAPLDDAMPALHGALTEIGIRAGDVLRIASGTRRGLLPGPRRISRHEALRLLPGLRVADLRGAILFWDGQIEDDARLVVAIARTAAAHGARILTYCEADALRSDRVTVRDVRGGGSFDVKCKRIVNATGVWAGELAPGVHLTPSKGSHLIIDAQTLQYPRAAMVVPVIGESARWVGATPTDDGRVIIGVTDNAYSGPIGDEPEVTEEEERYLLDHASKALARPLRSHDVIGRYAGYRPLLAGREGATADLSRRHAIVEDPETGALTIVGGKLTTYRRMAQDVVDRIVSGQRRPSRTASLPLVGAAPPDVIREVAAIPRLVRRYGIEAPAVAALAGYDRRLLEPIVAGLPVLGVELLFGVRHEGAITIDDLLDRRVRLGLVPGDRRAAEMHVASVVGELAA